MMREESTEAAWGFSDRVDGDSGWEGGVSREGR